MGEVNLPLYWLSELLSPCKALNPSLFFQGNIFAAVSNNWWFEDDC